MYFFLLSNNFFGFNIHCVDGLRALSKIQYSGKDMVRGNAETNPVV